jgi:hypothetical protein
MPPDLLLLGMQPSLPYVPFGSRTELKMGVVLLAVLLLFEVCVVWFNGANYLLSMIALAVPVAMLAVVIAVCNAAATAEPMSWKEIAGNILYWAGFVFLMLL